jgi:hypothetical protein
MTFSYREQLRYDELLSAYFWDLRGLLTDEERKALRLAVDHYRVRSGFRPGAQTVNMTSWPAEGADDEWDVDAEYEFWLPASGDTDTRVALVTWEQAVAIYKSAGVELIKESELASGTKGESSK